MRLSSSALRWCATSLSLGLACILGVGCLELGVRTEPDPAPRSLQSAPGGRLSPQSQPVETNLHDASTPCSELADSGPVPSKVECMSLPVKDGWAWRYHSHLMGYNICGDGTFARFEADLAASCRSDTSRCLALHDMRTGCTLLFIFADELAQAVAAETQIVLDAPSHTAEVGVLFGRPSTEEGFHESLRELLTMDRRKRQERRDYYEMRGRAKLLEHGNTVRDISIEQLVSLGIVSIRRDEILSEIESVEVALRQAENDSAATAEALRARLDALREKVRVDPAFAVLYQGSIRGGWVRLEPLIDVDLP